MKAPRYLDAQIDKMRSLYYDEGLTVAQVAQRLGAPKGTVNKAMLRNGMVLQTRSDYKFKGVEAGYSAKHCRVRAARGRPQKCEACGTTEPTLRYEWHNDSGNYDDIGAYQRLCKPCHMGITEHTQGISLPGSASRFCGVVRDGTKWRAQIGHNHNIHNLGNHATEIKAARVYDAKAVEFFGPNARTNFPQTGEEE